MGICAGDRSKVKRVGSDRFLQGALSIWKSRFNYHPSLVALCRWRVYVGIRLRELALLSSAKMEFNKLVLWILPMNTFAVGGLSEKI